MDAKKEADRVIALIDAGDEKGLRSLLAEEGKDPFVMQAARELSQELAVRGKAAPHALLLSKLALEYARKLGYEKPQAEFLHNIASFSWQDPDTPPPQEAALEGLAALEEALGLYEKLEDWQGAASARWGVGLYQYWLGRGEEALESFCESTQLSEKAEKPLGVAWGRLFEGKALMAHFPQRKDEALTALNDAKSLFQKEKDDWGLSYAESQLALLQK